MKILNYIDFLMILSLFHGLEKERLLGLLEKGAFIESFIKGKLIYLQNEKAETMDIILDGEIIVQNIDENGNVLSIVSLDKGDMLGGNLIFSNRNEYPMTLIAKTDIKLLRMKKDMILDLCQMDKRFLINLLQLLSDKALILTTKIHSLARKTIREKIMDFLILETNRQGSKTIILSMSKKELADRFGIERPSLQRELKKMQDEGLIYYDAKTISLR